MKTQKACRIELAASQDASRVAISEPYLDIKDGIAHLIATDGKILAILPVTVEPADVAGYVSGDVLKAARKTAARDGTVYAELNGVAKLPGGISMPREGSANAQQFPNWRQVVPSTPDVPAFVVALDAKRLWMLAQAMGTQGVTLTFTEARKPIFVTPANAGRYSDAVAPACMEARGVLMPIALPDKS